MTSFRMLLAGSAAAAFLSVAGAHAQQSPAPEAPGAPSEMPGGTGPCEVVPGETGDTISPGADETAGTSNGESLSETLERCGGVLAPAPAGDTEMVEPPPDKGATPVIPPSAVPEDE